MLYDPRVTLSPRPTRRSFDGRAYEQLQRAAQRIFGSRGDVVAVYLYGSAGRGEPAGDLDIAVLFRSEPPPRRELERLAAELQRAGAPNGPEIDLRCLNRAAPRFAVNVLRDGRRLVDRDSPARIEAEARFMSEWLDFRPVWERMRKRMLERLGDG